MSFTKQFIVQDETIHNSNEHVDKNGLPEANAQDYQATFAAALGLNTTGMVEVVISDLRQMIENEQRNSLEGYIQCLYRIMSHKLAWDCITRAFTGKNESVPSKIRNLFGRNEDEVKIPSRIIAE